MTTLQFPNSVAADRIAKKARFVLTLRKSTGRKASTRQPDNMLPPRHIISTKTTSTDRTVVRRSVLFNSFPTKVRAYFGHNLHDSRSKHLPKVKQLLTVTHGVSSVQYPSVSESSARGSIPCTAASISVILPAYNEEQNLPRTVEAAIEVLSNVADEWEIIVVNDGSEDDTRAVADGLAEQHANIRVIHHSENRGYGAALKSGILAAERELIFFTDSDGQFEFRELTQLIRWSQEYDIVMGYRAKRQDPLYRLVNAWGWNLLIRLVLGLKVRDIDCAFKLFRREVFDRVQIRSLGAMVNTEILAQAKSFGMRMHEIKVTHLPRCSGKPTGAKPRVIARAFAELYRLGRQLRNVEKNGNGLYVSGPGNISSDCVCTGAVSGSGENGVTGHVERNSRGSA